MYTNANVKIIFGLSRIIFNIICDRGDAMTHNLCFLACRAKGSAVKQEPLLDAAGEAGHRSVGTELDGGGGGGD